MYANEDIYTGTSDPSASINPKITGAFYINKTTAKLFVCTDNTFNNNIWRICNPDITIPDPPMVFGANWKYNAYKYTPNIIYHNLTGFPIFIFIHINYIYNLNDGYIKDLTNNVIISTTGDSTIPQAMWGIIIPGIKWRFNAASRYSISLEYSK